MYKTLQSNQKRSKSKNDYENDDDDHHHHITHRQAEVEKTQKKRNSDHGKEDDMIAKGNGINAVSPSYMLGM